VLLWRTFGIAARAEDLFGTLIAVGVGRRFAFQAFENIGMTVGIMPVTGLPLSFVSYGGPALLANFMTVGLLQNVCLRARGHVEDGTIGNHAEPPVGRGSGRFPQVRPHGS
jgi:rod shape determining protein RodA